MSKADRMFKKLGYIRKVEKVVPDAQKFYKDDDNVFVFDLEQKTFLKSEEYGDSCTRITVEELQAINEKVKELRLV